MSFEYPPRPERAIAPDLIPFYEGRGWVGQIKKNGTCSVVRVGSDGSTAYWNRHGEPHRAWPGHAEVSGFFSSFPDSFFVFELLHSKGPSVKDTAYVFDVTRFQGRSLIGTTLTDRLEILERLRPTTPKVVMVQTYTTGLRAIYDALSDPLDEGLVLKDPTSTLSGGWRPDLNGSWQIKCRRQSKNYSF